MLENLLGVKFSPLTARCSVFYTGLGWGNAEGASLLEALEYVAEHCTLVGGFVDVSAFSGNSMDELLSRRDELNEKFKDKIHLRAARIELPR